MAKKKFYITTSIAYTNAFPHIGYALETIQADVLARYHRLSGNDVFFLTGTDEHGAKVVKAAEAAGESPEAYVGKISERFRLLKGILNLSYDDFIRTSDQKKHWPSVKKVWLELEKKGDIYKKKYKGLYCTGCEAFITKKDLVDGKCAIHHREPEVIEEENYFFRLSKYSDKIEKAISSGSLKIIPKGRENEILSFIRQDLEDISFSRPRKDLKWAVPVPDDDEASVYVWADALTNYIAALGYDSDSAKFKKFWPADIHCIGKDILRFHAAIWPGMLLSLGLELPKIIFVHGFITVNGQKMSKSLGNIIDPFELVGKYGTDPSRYYLLREIPPAEDGDFTYDKFETRYNADLAGGLGNLVARVFAMVNKYCDGKVPRIEEKPGKHPLWVSNAVWNDLDKSLADFQFNEALISIWKFIAEADKYVDENKPWILFKEGKIKELNWVLYGLLDAISQIAWQINVFMPETSLKIGQALGISGLLKDERQYKDREKHIRPGAKIKEIGNLFPKIDKI